MRLWGALFLAALLGTAGCTGTETSQARTPASPVAPTTAPPVTTTTAPPPPIRWLAVGDSYSSGEGLTDADGTCARSPSAYPELARAEVARTAAVERFVSAACTGAWTPDWPSHLEAWGTGEPNLITATFGGNDVGFVGLMADCIGLDDGMEVLDGAADLDLGAVAQQFLNRGCDRPEADVEAEIDDVGATLEPLYEAMSDAVGPNGRVFVLGYPAPVTNPEGWSQGRCDGISGDDGRLLRRAAERLNRTIEAATEIRPNVHFVDIGPTFDSHGRCGAEPWLYGLGDAIEVTGQGEDTEVTLRAPFHPNNLGHEAMAELLASAISTTSTSS